MYKTMLSHCLKCRKNTESQNSEVLKTKNGRIMQCDRKKNEIYQRTRSQWLLNSLGIKTPLNKILLVGTLLF